MADAVPKLAAAQTSAIGAVRSTRLGGAAHRRRAAEPAYTAAQAGHQTADLGRAVLELGEFKEAATVFAAQDESVGPAFDLRQRRSTTAQADELHHARRLAHQTGEVRLALATPR